MRELTPEQQKEYDAMLDSLQYFQPRQAVWLAIMEAYDSPEWDWTKSDGCTLVGEWPSPCGYRAPFGVAHDYQCWLALQEPTKEGRTRLRRLADKVFFYGNLDFGIPGVVAGWRWLGVRSYWWVVGQWRHIKRGIQVKFKTSWKA